VHVGVAQNVSVGCVYAQEACSSSPLLVEGDDPAISDSNDPEVITNPSLSFDTVNPHHKSSGEIVVKNFRSVIASVNNSLCNVPSDTSNVQLCYEWLFYRPITEGPLWISPNEDAPLINKPSTSDETQFSVSPPAGTLGAKESKKFTFHFSPNKVMLMISLHPDHTSTCMSTVGRLLC